MDTLWGTISQIRADFSHLGMIWREVINYIEHLKNEQASNVYFLKDGTFIIRTYNRTVGTENLLYRRPRRKLY